MLSQTSPNRLTHGPKHPKCSPGRPQSSRRGAPCGWEIHGNPTTTWRNHLPMSNGRWNKMIWNMIWKRWNILSMVIWNKMEYDQEPRRIPFFLCFFFLSSMSAPDVQLLPASPGQSGAKRGRNEPGCSASS